MEQRLTIVPQVRHLLSTTLPARRRNYAAARSHRLLRLRRLQLQDST
jgi:hypothetical protein